MNGGLLRVATASLLVLGLVLIGLGQYDSGTIPDDEAAGVRGAGTENWYANDKCGKDSVGNCIETQDYSIKSGGGTLKSNLSANCGASSCGTYNNALSCSQG